jgi:hypothetical protein
MLLTFNVVRLSECEAVCNNLVTTTPCNTAPVCSSTIFCWGMAAHTSTAAKTGYTTPLPAGQAMLGTKRQALRHTLETAAPHLRRHAAPLRHPSTHLPSHSTPPLPRAPAPTCYATAPATRVATLKSAALTTGIARGLQSSDRKVRCLRAHTRTFTNGSTQPEPSTATRRA